MAESDELITLRSEVESLRMAIFQLQSARGGGGGGMDGGFFPIGDFGAGGGGGECKWVDPTDTEDNSDYEGEE